MISQFRRFVTGALLVAVASFSSLAAESGVGTSASASSASQPAATVNSASSAGSHPNTNTDPLLQLLVSKGVLSAQDVNKLATTPAADQRERLLLLLQEKGILSANDLNTLHGNGAVVPASLTTVPVAAVPAAAVPALPNGQKDEAGTVIPVNSAPPVPPLYGVPVPAVMPVRVLEPIASSQESFVPAIKLGENVRLQPYGLIQTSATYDTASPYGNDFPLPGFNPITNGPDKLPEFHLSARALRVGSTFQWDDISPNVLVTGKFEMDFSGNFNRSNNSNVASALSSNPRIRLAYGRIDWKTSENTTLNFLAGQDWSVFGSSTLPNLFESEGLGIGFGTLYQRAPQVRFGLNHNFGGFSLEPDFAVVFPAYGNLPADLTIQSGSLAGTPIPGNEGVANQLAFGERQGADSARPEIQARLVAQFQLDHSANVAPAQIIFSGVNGERDAVVLANQIPAAYAASFPHGARIHSKRDAWTGEIQLPTRFVTLVAKYYNGTDLREFFAGQIFGPFNDTTGLINTATAQSVEGASTLVFGCRGGTGVGCVGGVQVVANQYAPRAQGGFVNLGLPLSRWANANPEGRNAGWVWYWHYGYDQVMARDVRRLGGGRMKGDVTASSLQYKFNRYVTFVAEESLYRTRALPLTATGLFPSFAGRPMREINDFRSEFGTIFSF